MRQSAASLDALFTTWRLRWYPRILALSFALAIPISALGGEGSRALSGRVGGDLPAFYAAGRLLGAGRNHDLYDLQAQAAAQADLFPGPVHRHIVFYYPPFAALVYQPLSLLPYPAAHLLHTTLMALALWLAVSMLRTILPRVDRWAPEGFCLAFTFFPLFRAITGGQNTALTLLLLVAAWRALRDGRDLLAGCALGLMLFKPQFALVALALFLLAGRLRILLGALPVAGLLYLLGAAVSGWQWPLWWWPKALWLAGVYQSADAGNSVGWLGFFQAVMGVESTAAALLGWGLTLATALALACLWLRRRVSLDLRMAATALGLVLLQPHCMYYDAGLVVVTYAVLADRMGRRGLLPLAALWLLSFSAAAGARLGFNPLLLVLLASAALALRELLPARTMNREAP